LVIATEFGSYSVCLSDEALFNNVEAMETNFDDIASYLTSAPEKKKYLLSLLMQRRVYKNYFLNLKEFLDCRKASFLAKNRNR